MGRAARPGWQGIRRQPHGGSDARVSRHAHRAWSREPLSTSIRRGESRSVPPHARGRIRGRRSRAARQDRHGVREHEPARSGHVPNSQDAPSTHRQHVGHLSDVRLGARPVGLPRARHVFALLARVRRSSSTVRLVPRSAAAARAAAAADRVRASEPELHGHEQADAARACRGTPRQWMGRSAYAHVVGIATPRLYARSPFGISATASALRSVQTSSISRTSSTPSARTSMCVRRVSWPC